MYDIPEYHPETPEQEAELKAVLEFVGQMEALSRCERDTCPRCNAPIEILQQIGRCVYARPCGCRLWQGHVPQAWRTVQDDEVTYPEWAEEKRRKANTKLAKLKRLFSRL